MATFAEDTNRTATQDLFCTTGSYAAYQKLLISAVNITLSITAFLGNILILIALKKASFLRPPSKLLLGCLASTDLCVGLITEPLFVAYTISSEHSRLCYYLFIHFDRLGIILGGVSLSVNANCDECGQTSRLVVRAKIQTRCDINTSAELCCY